MSKEWARTCRVLPIPQSCRVPALGHIVEGQRYRRRQPPTSTIDPYLGPIRAIVTDVNSLG